jgi:2-dehydropantoate 2-reductase
MRHAILGLGGVGGLMAACLAKSGEEVTGIVRGNAAGQSSVLKLESPLLGDFSVQVSNNTCVPPVEVVWITVKATQLEDALRSIGSAEPVKAVVPLLNGLDHIARLRSKFGSEKVIPAAIRVESERVAPGHIVHRSLFVRLSFSSRAHPLLDGCAEKLNAMGFTCEFGDDEATLLWGKLVFLGPFALVTTAYGKNKGELAADRACWQEFEECVREACVVGKAEGAHVDAPSVLAFASSLPGHMQSSMQKDVAQGRTPELDAIGGAILRAAHKHNVAVPVTERLAGQVQRLAGAALPV